MIKLSLGSYVAFNTRCAFRKRLEETSFGYAMELKDLGRGIREYLALLDSDSRILQYAAVHPGEWKALRRCLVDSAWSTYHIRWAGLYKKRLPTMQWIAAGFALPREKYRILANILMQAAMSATLERVKRFSPQTYTVYRAVKTRLRNRPPLQ